MVRLGNAENIQKVIDIKNSNQEKVTFNSTLLIERMGEEFYNEFVAAYVDRATGFVSIPMLNVSSHHSPEQPIFYYDLLPDVVGCLECKDSSKKFVELSFRGVDDYAALQEVYYFGGMGELFKKDPENILRNAYTHMHHGDRVEATSEEFHDYLFDRHPNPVNERWQTNNLSITQEYYLSQSLMGDCLKHLERVVPSIFDSVTLYAFNSHGMVLTADYMHTAMMRTIIGDSKGYAIDSTASFTPKLVVLPNFNGEEQGW